MRLRKFFFAVVLCLLTLVTPELRSQDASPSKSMVVDHIAIYVTDLKTSVAFYKDVFGFEQVPIPVPFAAWLSMGHGVMLHVVGGRKEPVTNSKWDHLSIACADMDVMIASLEAKHIPWSNMEGKSAPAVRFDGVKQIFIKDPDGYWIEINDVLKKR